MDGNESTKSPKPLMPPPAPSDWTISELYSKSWEIIKKNKVLWIFGMAVVGFSGSSLSNLNLPSSSSSNNNVFSSPTPTPSVLHKVSDLPTSATVSSLPEKFTQVLGATTNTPFIDIIKSLFSQIPIYIYVILGIELLALILIFIAIAVIKQAWANAALIQGINGALDGKPVSIGESSEKAFSSIKSLSWLAIVPGLVFILTSLVVFGLLVFGFVLSTSGLKVIFGLLLFVASLAFLYALIHLIFAQIWATRLVILDKKSGNDALWAGYRMVRRKKWSMLLLGLVNVILSVFVIGIPVVLLVGFLLGGALSLDSNQTAGISLLILGGILLVVFIFGYLLLAGILTAFKASVWTIAYSKIKGKYEH